MLTEYTEQSMTQTVTCTQIIRKITPEQEQAEEPFLQDNPNRYVMFPIKYKPIWDTYKKHMASFWTAEEIDLSQDMKDWEKLNNDE